MKYIIKDNICDQCDYKCYTTADLNKHIKLVHDKIKDFECDKCNYICSNNNALNSHIIQVHDKIFNLKCDKCDYKCVNNSTLNRHKNICTGKFKGSSGEYKIINILNSFNINYSYNSNFDCLKSNNNGYLRFDFIIYIENQILFIEYDGQQHFKPVCFGGMLNKKAIERFENLQINDKIKNNYCKDNSFPLLRIPYNFKNNISFEIRKFILQNIL